MRRLVYICDWLPPDFGAVGQYAMLFARQWANKGWAVTLVGLTSGKSRRHQIGAVGDGAFGVLSIHRGTYTKQRLAARLAWTAASNVILLGAAFTAMWRAGAVLLPGHPPHTPRFIH